GSDVCSSDLSGSGEQAGAPDIGALAVDPDRGSRLADADGQDRYLRQMRLPQLGAQGQRRLAAARVAVIGAGGLGAPVLTYLAAAGIGEITLIDPDVVDRTNLHRQVIFESKDVGRSKAVTAAEHLHTLNPQMRVRALVDVVTAANALELLAGHDLVLDGTDNFPTRYLASDACEMLDIPLVWGSILAFSGQVSVFWGAGGRGVTYRDVHPVPPRPGEVPSCSEAGVLGMLCGVIGSTMAMEAAKVLAGMGEVLFGRLALYDALSARWEHLPIARDPARPAVTRLEDLTLTCGLPGPIGPGGAEVSAADLPGMLAAGVRVIDIREDHEVAGGMVSGAEHIAMSHLLTAAGDGTDERLSARALDGAVLYCAAGTRSGSTQRAPAARGIAGLSLAGGFAGPDGSQVATTAARRRNDSAASDGRQHVHPVALDQRMAFVGAGHGVDEEARASDHLGGPRGGRGGQGLDHALEAGGADGRGVAAVLGGGTGEQAHRDGGGSGRLGGGGLGGHGSSWGSWSTRGCGGCSAADGAHRPLRLDEVLAVHAVAGLLAPLGGPPDIGDVVVAASRAQRLAQVGLLPGEQAGAHAPLGGQAGAAAVGTEGPGHRGDHSHPAAVTAGGAIVDL